MYKLIFEPYYPDSYLFGPDANVQEFPYTHNRYSPENSSTSLPYTALTFNSTVGGVDQFPYAYSFAIGPTYLDTASIPLHSGQSLSIAGFSFGVADERSTRLEAYSWSPADGVLGLMPMDGPTPNQVLPAWKFIRPQLPGNVMTLWIEP